MTTHLLELSATGGCECRWYQQIQTGILQIHGQQNNKGIH